MASRSPRLSRPTVARLCDVAVVLPGVFSVSRPAPGDAAAPISMLTVRWLSAANDPLPELHVARVTDLRADRYRVRVGDVLVPSRSTSIRVAVAPPEIDGTVFNSTLLAVRCSEQIHPELLAAYLMHPAGAAHLVSASQSGTAQMNLTTAALGEVPVPLVPIEQQQELAALLAAADVAHRNATEAAELRRRVAHDVVISRMTGRNNVHA